MVSTEYLEVVSTEYLEVVSTEYLEVVSTEYLEVVSIYDRSTERRRNKTNETRQATGKGEISKENVSRFFKKSSLLVGECVG